MAGPWYVDSNGTYTDGLSWAGAFASLSDCIDGTLAAGETIYVAHDHVGDYGDVDKTLTFPGTQLAPNYIICLNSGTDVAATTAIEEAIGGTSGDLRLGGNFISIGVNYIAGAYLEISKTLSDQQRFSDCYMKCGNNSTAAYTIEIVGGTEGLTELNNVDLKFNGSGQSINWTSSTTFLWNGGSVIADSTAPYVLFNAATYPGYITITGVDLSLVSTALIDDTGVSEPAGGTNFKFHNCLLHASVALSQDTIVSVVDAKMHGCDDATGDDPLRFEEIQHQRGSIYSDTGVKVTASDLSAKLVATGNGEPFFDPLTFDLVEMYMDANPTIRVELNIDNVELKDNECWIEIEYPDDDNPALRNFDRTSKGAYDSTTTLQTSTVAWTESFGTEKPQYIEETISGGSAGLHKVKLCLARSSATTLYADPDVTVS